MHHSGKEYRLQVYTHQDQIPPHDQSLTDQPRHTKPVVPQPGCPIESPDKLLQPVAEATLHIT